MFSFTKSHKKFSFLILYVLAEIFASTIVDSYYQEEQRPIYATAGVGDYVTFNCRIDFPQHIPIAYKLNWNKDNKTIFSYYEGIVTTIDPYVGRINLINNTAFGRASINLTSIRDTDEGWYQCEILFPNRTPSYRNNGTWFYLNVPGGNLLGIPPINQTVIEGDEANFNCLTKDPDLKVNWKKDGIPLQEYQDLMHRSYITPDNTLVIKPTDMADFGEYECEVINEQTNENQTARAFLNVHYKAKVIFAPPEVYLPFGQSALINCHFRANPPLTNLRWEKDGFLFDPYNIQGVFYRRNGSLFFRQVDDSHAGLYTCTPYNDLGTQGPSPPINVIVQRPPIFSISPHNLYLKKLGETLEIPCDAKDGENGHKPLIVWYKLGGTLPVGRYSINNGNLTIVNIQEGDRGRYQCSATNKAATIVAETELLVENIPSSAPYNLTGISSATSVHLKWVAGRYRENVEYNVWYKPVESTKWNTYQVISTRTLEATITGLAPGHEYEFMVLSKDDNGDGLFSKSIRLWTKIGNGDTETQKNNFFPPVGYPRNITVTPTEDGFVVAWEPPEYGNENLKFYGVRWFEDDYIVGFYETTERSVLLDGLKKGNQYGIQVIAVTFDDQQAVSEKIVFVVPGDRRFRAISTGIITGLAFLVAVTVTVYYARKKWCRKYQQNIKEEKNVKEMK